MQEKNSQASRNLRFAKWRVVDIVTASLIGVASGLIFWAWGILYGPLSAILAFTPGLTALLGGGWLFAGVLGALIIRKPGAAIYVELIAAVVSALLGSAWGLGALFSGLIQGIGAEVIFALFLYANYRAFVAVLAGATSGLVMAVYEIFIYYPATGSFFHTVYIISGVLSGAIIAGVLPFSAVKALAKAGALSRFPAGSK